MRVTSDWVDLQWSLTIDSLERVAPQARGRLILSAPFQFRLHEQPHDYLALRVARLGGLAQALGKLSHEGEAAERVRFWTLPFVGPSMLGISAAARVMDRVANDPEETLGFLVVARHAKPGGIA